MKYLILICLFASCAVATVTPEETYNTAYYKSKSDSIVVIDGKDYPTEIQYVNIIPVARYELKPVILDSTYVYVKKRKR